MKRINKIIEDFEKIISDKYFYYNEYKAVSVFIKRLDFIIKNNLLQQKTIKTNYVQNIDMCDELGKLDDELENLIELKHDIFNILKKNEFKKDLSLKLDGPIENKINYILRTNKEVPDYLCDRMWGEINKKIITIKQYSNEYQDKIFELVYKINNEYKSFTLNYSMFPKKLKIKFRINCPKVNELDIIESKCIWLLPEECMWQYKEEKSYSLQKLIENNILHI